jgi:hypothetical protein
MGNDEREARAAAGFHDSILSFLVAPARSSTHLKVKLHRDGFSVYLNSHVRLDLL